MNPLQKYKTNKNFQFENQTRASLDLGIKDVGYLEFLNSGFSGLYFSNALHLYGESSNEYHDINSVNRRFKSVFNFIIEELYCFGCDLFGNQFCFRDHEIVFFNIESGTSEFVAKNFKEWVDVLLADYNYYTGEQILQEWESLMLPLNSEERLVPIKPFIIGGEYSPNNMKTLDFYKTLEYNGSIARQIFNLPEGTEIQLQTNPTNDH